MRKFNWASRTGKRSVRDYQLNVNAKKRGIFLPGWDTQAIDGCFCVKRAIELGVITKETEIIAVERDPEIAPLIEAKLKSMGLRYRMHVGPLSTLKLDDPVDYAFFDFLGCLDAPTSRWMRDVLAPRLTPGTDLSFTFAYAFRSNSFMKECSKSFMTEFATLARESEEHYQITDWHVLLYIMVLKSIFVGHEFEYRMAQKYQDNVASMLAYRMEKFTPKKQDVWPPLNMIASETARGLKSSQPVKVPMVAMTPAQKAWATRRAAQAMPA